MIIAGIDPGKSGGLAVIDEAGKVSVTAMPIAGKVYDGPRINDFIRRVDLVVIEKVAARPGQGVTGMFNFGTGYGMLQGICLGAGIPYELVRPQEWKNLILKGTPKDKDAAIAYCRHRYPHVSLLPTPKCRKPSDGIADALCLMEYGRRVFSGEMVAA